MRSPKQQQQTNKRKSGELTDKSSGYRESGRDKNGGGNRWPPGERGANGNRELGPEFRAGSTDRNSGSLRHHVSFSTSYCPFLSTQSPSRAQTRSPGVPDLWVSIEVGVSPLLALPPPPSFSTGYGIRDSPLAESTEHRRLGPASLSVGRPRHQCWIGGREVLGSIEWRRWVDVRS